MWIVDDEHDDSLGCPRQCDIPLMIADRTFDRHNQLTDPFAGLRPPADGVTGNRVLVNGAHLPHHRAAPRRHRLRILNASHFRTYNLFLSNGAEIIQIGTDSGLMPRPVRRREILLGPGRAGRGRRRLLAFRRRVGRVAQRPRGAAERARRPHLRRRVDAVPGRLAAGAGQDQGAAAAAPAARLGRKASPKPDRTWTIAIGGGFSPVWTINGKTFNPARSDAFPALGTTETWEIVNRTGVPHMIHMHHTDWYLLSRDGRPPPPWEDCLKETFFIRAGERIVVAGHFADYTGKYVIHCHMLDHEDHGLMSQFEVVRGRRSG